MQICPGCHNEIENQETCLVCDSLKVIKHKTAPPKIRRCSKISFSFLIAAQVLTPILSLAFVIFGIFDLIDGNFAQIILLPLFILFATVQFVLIDLAIDYAEGREFPKLESDS